MVITQFLGIQNFVSARDIEDGALQDAVDVDITNSGGVVARPGYQLALTVPISTAYSTQDDVTYIVSEGSLYRVRPDLGVTLIGPSIATEFCDYSRTLFTNDGWSVFQDMISNLVIPTPNEPGIVITSGSRPAGMYNILCTYTDNEGKEGGTSALVHVELSSDGDILVTPELPTGFTTNVYMTEAGGEVFYDVVTGAQLLPMLINANPFPVRADKIELYESRLYVSEAMGDHTVIWYSKAFHYHLFGIDGDYLIIPGKVEVLRASSQGLVIGTSDEIYVYLDDSLTKLTNYGVVAGRPITKLADGSLMIHTTIGVASYPPFKTLTYGTVALPMGTSCSTAIIYERGLDKYVALHNESDPYNQF